MFRTRLGKKPISYFFFLLIADLRGKKCSDCDSLIENNTSHDMQFSTSLYYLWLQNILSLRNIILSYWKSDFLKKYVIKTSCIIKYLH